MNKQQKKDLTKAVIKYEVPYLSDVKTGMGEGNDTMFFRQFSVSIKLEGYPKYIVFDFGTLASFLKYILEADQSFLMYAYGQKIDHIYMRSGGDYAIVSDHGAFNKKKGLIYKLGRRGPDEEGAVHQAPETVRYSQFVLKVTREVMWCPRFHVRVPEQIEACKLWAAWENAQGIPGGNWDHLRPPFYHDPQEVHDTVSHFLRVNPGSSTMRKLLQWAVNRLAVEGEYLAAQKEAKAAADAIAAVEEAKREDENQRLEKEDDILNMTNVCKHIRYSLAPFNHPKW